VDALPAVPDRLKAKSGSKLSLIVSSSTQENEPTAFTFSKCDTTVVPDESGTSSCSVTPNQPLTSTPSDHPSIAVTPMNSRSPLNWSQVSQVRCSSAPTPWHSPSGVAANRSSQT
jgi:hypothetical protein